MSQVFDPDSHDAAELWRIFLEICGIPHPSHHEESLALWALERAARLGLDARRDGVGNVIIRKPPKPGREGAAGVILQAHLDMVPQKVSDIEHDFTKDPIRPRLDPDDPAWLRATGTTLGADDGLGVAAGFALLGDDSLDHGPLELLLTVNEEDGMTGAEGLAGGSLSGRYLINLDSERGDELCVGSAGGQRMSFSFSEAAMAVPTSYFWLSVSVTGLRGGHSGGEIQLGRANAIRVLASLFDGASGLRFASVAGGSLPNAIPREARAIVGAPEGQVEALRSRIKEAAARLADTYRSADPGLRVDIEAVRPPLVAMGEESAARILDALSSMPDGLQSLLDGMDDVARLSSNLGALETRIEEGGEFEVRKIIVAGRLLARGAFDEEKAALLASIRRYLEGAGAEIVMAAPRSSWPPDLSSRLLARAREVWTESLGREPRVRATHGGLECNLFRPSYPGWDMLSIGPTIRFPHSPDEAVEISSVGPFYRRARRLIEVLSR
ncbi:MAG TPA: beta-Ala-His dipeptidase [Rectinemataceae bacterium]|nr:beta-Ala-His dipeptidase [Rectinemataceae bacterium]